MFADHAHVDHAEDGRGDRTGKNGGLGSQNLELSRREGKTTDENRHGKADAAQNAHAGDHVPVDVMRQLAGLELDQGKRHAKDANRLTQQHAKVHAKRHRVGQQRAHVHAHQANLRVDEREDRQDHKVNRRGDQALHADERRSHAVHDALDLGGRDSKVVLAQDVRLVVVAVVEQRQALAQPIGEAIELDAALSRNGKGQDDAGERSMHAALEHAEPQQQAQHRIRSQAVVLSLVEPHECAGHNRGGAQPKRVGALTVKDSDSGDGDQVVGDGERREKHTHAVGHAVAQKRQHAQRKGDIGCHGNGPAVAGAGMVKDEVDAGGNDDATHGGQHREHSLTRVLELADRHLVLKLNAHQQKEDRHEEVVDEKLNGQAGRKMPQAHIQRSLQKVMDGLVGIGVGADNGGDGGKHHDGGRNRAVLGDALPNVVTLKTLALTDVEQLLGCCHGRLLSREGSRLKKARPAQVAAPRSNVLRLHLAYPARQARKLGRKAEPQVEHYLLNGTGAPVQETARRRAQKTTGARSVRGPVVGVRSKEPNRRP